MPLVDGVHRIRLGRGLIPAVIGATVAGQATGLDRDLSLALLLAAGAVLLAVGTWDRLQAHIGPRHVLDLALPLAALVVLVLAVAQPLGLPGALAWLTHPLLGACLAVAWLGQGRLVGRQGASGWLGDGLSALAGGLVWLTLVTVLGLAAPMGYLGLVVATLAAWWGVWPADDPVRPGPSPLRPYVPWGQFQARRWPTWPRVPLRAPASLVYLMVSWGLFLWLGQPQADGFGLDTTAYEAYLYSIPQLTQAPLDAAGSLVTALFLNHDDVQLIYVTVLLGLFGVPFEVKEGTGRTTAIFAVTGLLGALVAGVLLYGLVALYPEVGFFEQAWQRTWSGGSAGAFGLMGALAARARRPGPLFAFFVFWELNVGAWFLRSYTPAFHLTALATGYLLARYLLDPPARPT